ncbi:hypothetical protein K438DRAFT_1771441 [Mycena galopus ATCC 62051]|nr:hypothetical protein K438DRAFT_1771441 [Mycena galopus ATCC 62051]
MNGARRITRGIRFDVGGGSLYRCLRGSPSALSEPRLNNRRARRQDRRAAPVPTLPLLYCLPSSCPPVLILFPLLCPSPSCDALPSRSWCTFNDNDTPCSLRFSSPTQPTQLGSVRVSVSAPCASPIKLTLSEHPRAPRTRLSLPAALEVGKHLEYSITPYVRAAAPSDPHVPPPSDLHINSDTNLSGRVYTDSVRVDISPRRFGGSWFAFSTPSNSMFILSVYLSRDYSREFKTTDKLDPNPTGS